jgi:AbrB family looped-hinge helix DNA binding protein
LQNEEAGMSTVVVSQGFQVLIPKEIRKRNGIAPGQKMRIISFDDRIELIPFREMNEARGFLKDTCDESVREFIRDEEDRV